MTRLDTQVNKTVQTLGLKDNEIGDQGTIALTDALKVSFCLVPRTFRIFGVTAALGNVLCGMFLECCFGQVNDTLLQVDVRYNSIGAKGAELLAGAVMVR